MKLNSALNYAPSNIIFTRGLECLLERSRCIASGEHSAEQRLPMDEAEATRRIKELASLLKKGKWTYFMTLTDNDADSGCV